MYSLQELLKFLPDTLGVIGVLLVLWYYFLLQIGKCTSDTLGYSVANLLGSGLVLISLCFNWNLASMIIEIFWVLISLYGVIKYLSRPMVQR